MKCTMRRKMCIASVCMLVISATFSILNIKRYMDKHTDKLYIYREWGRTSPDRQLRTATQSVMSDNTRLRSITTGVNHKEHSPLLTVFDAKVDLTDVHNPDITLNSSRGWNFSHISTAERLQKDGLKNKSLDYSCHITKPAEFGNGGIFELLDDGFSYVYSAYYDSRSENIKVWPFIMYVIISKLTYMGCMAAITVRHGDCVYRNQ